MPLSAQINLLYLRDGLPDKQHMILNFLEQEGISGRVDGEYLQGAIGELQTMNFVRVLVSEEDYADAKKIINKRESIQPASDGTIREARPAARFLHFVIGFVVGAVTMYWKLNGTAP